MTRQRTFSSTEITEDQIHTSIFRVLLCNFKEQNDSQVFLPETAESFKQFPATSTTDLISQCLMEMIIMISNEPNPFKNLNQNFDGDNLSMNSFSVSPTQNLSPSPSPVSGCPVPLLPFKSQQFDSPSVVAINYLLESYNRVSSEERVHPKKSSIPPLSDVLQDLR